MKKRMSKKKSIPSLVLIGVLVTGLGVGNYFAMKYKPIITTYMGHKVMKLKKMAMAQKIRSILKHRFPVRRNVCWQMRQQDV